MEAGSQKAAGLGPLFAGFAHSPTMRLRLQVAEKQFLEHVRQGQGGFHGFI